MKGHSPLMSSHYTKHSRAPQEMLPHFCSWSCNVSVPPYFWGGCEWCCHMLCRKAWDEEWEAESCEKLPLLRSLGSSKARGKAAVPRHWWDAETVPAFWQGKLCDKGKGWIPPGFTFFPVLPSIVFIMYISSLIHHLLAPSHLCVSAWAWQPQVFFYFTELLKSQHEEKEAFQLPYLMTEVSALLVTWQPWCDALQITERPKSHHAVVAIN